MVESIRSCQPEALAELSGRSRDVRVAEGLIQILVQTSADRWPRQAKPGLLELFLLIFRHGSEDSAMRLLNAAQDLAQRPEEGRMASWIAHQGTKVAALMRAQARHTSDEELQVPSVLAIAEQYLEADPVRALEALLLVWRSIRAPELAQLIEVLSDRIRASRPPLPVRKAKSSWLNLARHENSADLGRLLESVGPQEGGLQEKIEALRNWSPDPRIAAALLGLLQREHRPTMLFEIALGLLMHADPRSLEPIKEYGGAFMTETAHALEDLWSQPCPAGVLEALVKRIGRRKPRSDKDVEQELLAAVYDAPKDDAPRMIYADWLLERGDPRGEFIVLQLEKTRRALTAQEQAQEKLLIERHATRWLGVFATAIVGRRDFEFSRGFPHAFWLKLRDADQAQRLYSSPAWATVEVLRLGAGVEHAAPLLELPGLKRIGGLTQALALRLCQLDRAIEEIEIRTPEERAPFSDALLEGLEHRLPGLRALYISGRDTEACYGALSACAERLERFGLRSVIHDREEYRGWLRGVQQLAPAVPRVDLEMSRPLWGPRTTVLSWRLDSADVRTVLRGDCENEPSTVQSLYWVLVGTLDVLPKDGLSRLEWAHEWPVTKRELRPLKRALRRFSGVTVEPALPG